jgi:hypothetical protein
MVKLCHAKKSNRGEKGPESLPVIRNTGQCIVPSQERSKQAKPAASLDHSCIWCAFYSLQVSDGEKHECHVEGEEQQEEGDRRAERTNQQYEGEDEPAHEEEPKCICEVVRACTSRLSGCRISRCIGGHNIETTRCEDNGEGNPETTV